MAFNAGDIEAKLTLDRRPFQREMDAAIREGRRFSKMEFEATLDANKKPFDKALAGARASGERFAAKKYNAKLGVDRTEFAKSLRKAASEVQRINSERGSARIGLDTDEAIREANKLERHTRYVGIQVANNFRSPLRKVKWPAIFAAITAGAIAVPPALFGVVGAFGAVAGAVIEPIKVLTAFEKAQEAVKNGSDDAAAQMAEFRQAMRDLTPAGRDFVRQVNAMDDELDKFGDAMQRAVLPGITSLINGIEVAAPAITRGSAAVGEAFSRVTHRAGEMFRHPVFQGQLEQAFENSVPVIEAAGDIIFTLFGDMVRFTAQTKSMGEGLGDMFYEVGNGFTRFFETLVPYSDTLGRSFASLGGIAGDLVAMLGRFSGIISTGTAPGLESLRTTLQQLYDTGLALIEGALPGITTAWLGFSTAVGTALAALEPIAPLLGTVVGSLAPFAVALKAIDLITFGRIGAQFANLKTGIAASATATGKAKTALSGLASIGFGPLGIAAAAVGTALMVLGQRQQEAAQAAAEHKEQVRNLTAAIIEDNGVIGQATRQYQLKQAADEGLINTARQFGIDTGLVTQALLGNKDAAAQVEAQTISLRKPLLDLNGVTGDTRTKMIEQGEALVNLRFRTWDYNRAAREAAEAALVERAAMNGVTVEALKQMNAMQALYTQQMAMIDASLGLREAQHSLKKAQKATTKAQKEHGRASQEYKDAALQEERAIQQVISATHRKTLEQNIATGAEKAGARATEAADRAALKMAATYQGRLPPVLRQYVRGMDESRAAAAGAKVETDKLGRAVITLPNGKKIRLRVDAAQAQQAINDLNNALNSIQTYKETVVAVRYTESGRAIAGTSGIPKNAEGAINVHEFATGGLTWKGKPVKPMASGYATMVPPNTPRLIGDNTSRVESFIPHDNSMRSIGLLRETNRRMGDPLGITERFTVKAPAPAPVTETNIYRFEPGSVTLDVSGIRDIQDVVDLMGNLRQFARANGARVSTRGRE